MPLRDGAGATESVLAPPRCLSVASGAPLHPAGGEVASVNLTVALVAQRQTVVQNESEVGELSPRFDVVGVEQSGAATAPASVAITAEHSYPPSSGLWREPSAISFRRLPVFPVSGERSNHVRVGAFARAVRAAVRCPFERPATHTEHGGRSVSPTCLGAELRCAGSVTVGRVRLATNSTRQRRASIRRHTQIISEIEPAYCDVIVRRWEHVTGLKAERA